MGDWHRDATVPELLSGYARTLAELRSRGVVRTNNAPAGDYAEWLVARALNGAIADDKAAKSYDLTLPDGRLVQLKARVVSEPSAPGQTQTSPFRSWDFDLAALVLLRGADYVPVLGILAPVAVVKQHVRHQKHVNGHIAYIRPPLTTAAGTEDITDPLVDVAAG
jgi:hypothetical protein